MNGFHARTFMADADTSARINNLAEEMDRLTAKVRKLEARLMVHEKFMRGMEVDVQKLNRKK